MEKEHVTSLEMSRRLFGVGIVGPHSFAWIKNARDEWVVMPTNSLAALVFHNKVRDVFPAYLLDELFSMSKTDITIMCSLGNFYVEAALPRPEHCQANDGCEHWKVSTNTVSKRLLDSVASVLMCTSRGSCFDY